MLTVVDVGPNSNLLKNVQAMWRAQSATLGFFPEGAFEQHARERTVLAAVDTVGSLLGYVLFRHTRGGRVVITQLCVDPEIRQQGIARALFEGMKERLSHCHEITLWCRRDFDAHRIWPRLGFIPVGDKQGRGKEKKTLTKWRYELSQLPFKDHCCGCDILRDSRSRDSRDIRQGSRAIRYRDRVAS